MTAEEIRDEMNEVLEKIGNAKDSADSAEDSAQSASEKAGNAESEAAEAKSEMEDAASAMEALMEKVDAMAEAHNKTEEEIRVRVKREAREMLKAVVIEMVARLFPEDEPVKEADAPVSEPVEQGA